MTPQELEKFDPTLYNAIIAIGMKQITTNETGAFSGNKYQLTCETEALTDAEIAARSAARIERFKQRNGIA